MTFRISLILLLLAVPLAAADPNGNWFSQGYEQATDWFRKGGSTMWLLGAASLAGVAFCIERLVRVRRGGIIPRSLSLKFRDLLSKGDIAGAKALATQQPCTLSRAVEAMLEQNHADSARTSAAGLEAAVMELRPLLRSNKPLIVVASIAPLLGLMGTVLGMIGAFEQFALLGQSGEPAIFATHISEALVTTATGLLIAVPATVTYHFFKMRVMKFSEEIEVAINRSAALLATSAKG